jgi:chemotaxis protein CheX
VDQTFVIAFVKSAQNVFETMLQLPVTVGQPAVKKPGPPANDVSGIIGMSGDVEGSIVLSFPTQTAERIVSLFTGVELDHAHEDFADAVGELVNMISGGAKVHFTGASVSISCPSVVIGADHVVFGGKDVVTVALPCSSDVGEFSLEVSIRQSSLQSAAPAA